MAVQELSREQAKEEIKKLKKEMKEDSSKEEENLKAIEELMDQIEKRSKDKKDPVDSDAKPDPGKKKNVLYAKDGGSVEGKRLTRTIPPKKGPNSQGMRGTGAAIRGTKFKGVF